MGAKDEDLHTIDVTVGFADLVSFTALSNTLDRDEIGDLVEVFESRCQDVVARYGGRIIKSLGDSVLFVTSGAEDGVAVAEGIINVIGRDAKMPDVRLGLASGPVVQRLGDIFGPPVNMAARLTQVARRNRLIVDQNTADLLPQSGVGAPAAPGAPGPGLRAGRAGRRTTSLTLRGAPRRWTRPLGHNSPIRTTRAAWDPYLQRVLAVQDVRLDPTTRQVWRGEREITPLPQGVPAPAGADGAPR